MLSTHNAAEDTSMISDISRQINGANLNLSVCHLGVQLSVGIITSITIYRKQWNLTFPFERN